ncbi:MAG: MarR family transcriptional regulator [Ruminococcaceae bacterium]|nr:MarR family transcriptional regulator [Oscillospiraceae bacterium]
MQGNRFEVFSPAVIQLAKTVQYLKSRKLAEHHLKGTNAMCLCYILDSQGGGLSATELAKVCGIDKAQVSRCMAELTDLGYVYRNDMGGRRYKQKYQLTDKGLTVADDLDNASRDIQNTLRKGISTEDLDRFYRCLSKICENFSDLLNEQ